VAAAARRRSRRPSVARWPGSAMRSATRCWPCTGVSPAAARPEVQSPASQQGPTAATSGFSPPVSATADAAPQPVVVILLMRGRSGIFRPAQPEHAMNRLAMWGTAAALSVLAACSKQADVPATAIVVPASAPLPQVPSAPASDPSLPSAAVVASQPTATAGPEIPTGSPNPASGAGGTSAAAAGAPAERTSPPASAASQP